MPGLTAPVRRARAGAAIGLVLAAALSSGCGSPRDLKARATSEWRRSYDLAPGAEVQVVGAVGEITVQAGDAPGLVVRAERVVRAVNDPMARALVERVTITEEVTPDRVLLRNDGLGGVVLGAEVEVDFHLVVRPDARLRLHASGGRITVTDVSGDIIASTTNGGVDIRGSRGGVDARTVNGNASVDLAAVGEVPVLVRAVNGTTTLLLPADAKADIDASVANGTIDVEGLAIDGADEQSPRELIGRLGGGGTSIRVSATNGAVHLRARP